MDYLTYPHTDAANLAGRRREYALLRLALAARDSAGPTIIAANGVTARFTTVTVTRDGQVVRVTLAP